MKSLYVAAAYRGAGVADRLMDMAIGSAAAHLWVFEENHRALAFYGKHGFTPAGDREVDSDTGIWMMRLVRDGGRSGAHADPLAEPA